MLLFAVGSSWVPAWQLAPGWGTGTRYNAKGRLGLAGLRSLLLGFNYIIPQPGMTPFPRNCIGGTKTKGPKGDRRGTEGGPKVSTLLCVIFSLPPLPLSLSRRLRRAAEKDRRGTEGGPKACILLASGTLGGHVFLPGIMLFAHTDLLSYCFQRCVFL